MQDFEKIYNNFEKSRQTANMAKVTAFISGLESGLINDLNKKYIEDKSNYDTFVNNIKSQGIKVFRNNEGKHKLDMTNYDFSMIAPYLNKM